MYISIVIYTVEIKIALFRTALRAYELKSARSANELKTTLGSPDQLHSSFKDLHWISRGAILPQFVPATRDWCEVGLIYPISSLCIFDVCYML